MAAPALKGDPQITQDGGNVVLHCIVVSKDAPTCKWSKDEKDVNADDTYKMAVDKEGANFKVSCTIVSFDKPHAGVYKVALTNAAGASSATFNLTAGDAPDFADKPHIVQRDGGMILGIKVRIASKTPPTIEWYREDVIIKYDDHVKNVERKEKEEGKYMFVLEINGPQKTDEGKYTCIVKNSEGQNSQSLNLNFD